MTDPEISCVRVSPPAQDLAAGAIWDWHALPEALAACAPGDPHLVTRRDRGRVCD